MIKVYGFDPDKISATGSTEEEIAILKEIGFRYHSGSLFIYFPSGKGDPQFDLKNYPAYGAAIIDRLIDAGAVFCMSVHGGGFEQQIPYLQEKGLINPAKKVKYLD